MVKQEFQSKGLVDLEKVTDLVFDEKIEREVILVLGIELSNEEIQEAGKEFDRLTQSYVFQDSGSTKEPFQPATF